MPRPHDPRSADPTPAPEVPPTGAGAPRVPTADPNVFVVPAAQLPPGFAERLGTEPAEPAEPRRAATAALVRDGEEGLEVLLLRRHRRSGFAADAWVFPGGVVDPADREPGLEERSVGPTAAMWAHRLGLTDPAEALGYVAAAVRETLEETGILIARGAGGEVHADAALARARAALLAGGATLLEVLRDADARFAGGDLLYLAHWITPLPEPRRYDTRFFLARVPADAACEPQPGELTDGRWVTPAAGVEAYGRGELRMLPPTLKTLQRLAAFSSVDAAWRELEGAPVAAILPRMHRDARGVVIEIVPDE